MTMATPEEHLHALLASAPAERVNAARALLQSLEDDVPDQDQEAAWASELTLRARGILDGTRETVDGDEAAARVRARVAALSK